MAQQQHASVQDWPHHARCEFALGVATTLENLKIWAQNTATRIRIVKAESHLVVCVSVCIFFVLCVYTWYVKSPTQQHRIRLICCIICRKWTCFNFLAYDITQPVKITGHYGSIGKTHNAKCVSALNRAPCGPGLLVAFVFPPPPFGTVRRDANNRPIVEQLLVVVLVVTSVTGICQIVRWRNWSLKNGSQVTQLLRKSGDRLSQLWNNWNGFEQAGYRLSGPQR